VPTGRERFIRFYKLRQPSLRFGGHSVIAKLLEGG
jgi:hypothetical protein